tara:strand:- start:358 stop:1158 length:801 start_codon:yes stop_codon:yes gene_type:complete
MNEHKPTFQFVEPEPQHKDVIRRVILGFSDHPVDMRLPIRPTGFAYLTYSRYPQDIVLHFSNEKLKPEGKLGMANQIFKEHPYFHIKGRFYQIGIEVLPHIPYILFGLSGTQLLNKAHVFPPDATNIHQLTGELDQIEEPIEVALAMQRFLRENIERVKTEHAIEKMLQDIYDSHGKIQVSDLADKYHISPRHQQRLFKKYIGLTPKQYAMVIQFNHVQQKFLNGTTSFENYHDQAHFTKICKRITGFTPLEFMKSNNDFLFEYLK